MGYITMNDKEREQAKVFELVKQGMITQVVAAARLRISDRWVRSKIKRYHKSGDAGLVHLNRGKTSRAKWNSKEEQLLIDLLQGEWHDFGPTFASEKLNELHDIRVSCEVVRKAMIKAGLWKPKQRKRKHRKRRERRPMFGMMIQLDGSPHDWFEGRGEPCTLLVFIDDATSEILWLEFAKSESSGSVMGATKSYIQAYGIPVSFYTDYGSVFHVNLNNKENEKKTQWERAVAQLGSEVIHARSPQAKGRVERCNQTMQDRLQKELRLAGVSSIDEANKYLRSSNFIANHNARFAVKPEQQGDSHADCSDYNLDDIFSIQETRILTNDFTITFQKRIFQLSAYQKTIIRPKHSITVKTALDGSISLWVRKIKLEFKELTEKPPKEVTDKKLAQWKPHKPSENSRRWVNGLMPLSRVKPASPAVEVK